MNGAPKSVLSDRRALLQRVGAALAVSIAIAALGACGDEDGSGNAGGSAGDVESDSVIVADYGGTTRAARTEASLLPFTDMSGARAVSADADPAKLQLFAENERAEWDMIDLDGWDVVRFSDQGLIQELPPEVARNELVPEKFRDYGAGGYIASVGIGYNTEEGAVPKTWADFFNTEKFPGKRALPNFGYMAVEAALLADGVPCDKLYPLDFDRAFRKLDEIRDDTLFWDSFGQSIQFLAQGSASMVLNSGGRVMILRDQGLPVDFVWKDALLQWSGLGIPVHAEHPDAAFALADLMAQPEQQAQFSRLTFYGPTNPDALELLDKTTLNRLPNSEEHASLACEIDAVALSKQVDEYSKRYSEWLAEG